MIEIIISIKVDTTLEDIIEVVATIITDINFTVDTIIDIEKEDIDHIMKIIIIVKIVMLDEEPILIDILEAENELIVVIEDRS